MKRRFLIINPTRHGGKSLLGAANFLYIEYARGFQPCQQDAKAPPSVFEDGGALMQPIRKDYSAKEVPHSGQNLGASPSAGL